MHSLFLFFLFLFVSFPSSISSSFNPSKDINNTNSTSRSLRNKNNYWPHLRKPKRTSKRNSCIHRNELRFHQNIPETNYAFQQSLRHYETLHEEATKNQTQLISDLKSTNLTSKYVVLRLDISGLGNRMHTILSGFLFALLTNRILLLIQEEFHIEQSFCQPFVNSNWLFPQDIDWDLDIPKANIRDIQGPFYDEQEDYFVSQHSTEDKIFFLSQGEQYFIPLFYLNPYFHQQLQVWFPNQNPGTHLIHYLFHPRDHIWTRILETYATMKRDPMTFTIGLQLRNAGQENEWDCLDSQHWSNNSYVFIASLTKIQDETLNTLMTVNKWKITQRYADSLEQHTNNQFDHAIHDIWILSMMDEIILTPKSTLGYMAMLLAGKRALYPSSESFTKCSSDMNADPLVKCYRTTSYDPCYHRSFARNYERLQSNETINRFTNKTMFDSLFIKCEDYCYDSETTLKNIGWKLQTI